MGWPLNDSVLAQRMTELRSHGIVREPERFEQQVAASWVYERSSWVLTIE